jgi:predicted transposase YbfD/YdcC
LPFAPLLAALAGVRDPRRAQGQRYSMRHLLLFSVLALLAGATSYQGIVTFIGLQRDRLNTVFGACFRRAPAVNTLRHLFLTLDRDDLEAAFRRHACALSASTPGVLRTIALDGKTLRGSVDHPNDRKAAHVLSAFAGDAALILAHQEVAGAPDEIPAVPRLIAGLGMTGVLFTADALHCQKEGFARAAETGNALCWSGSRRTSPPCMPPSPDSAPSNAPSAATRRWTAAAMAARSIGASRSSTPPVIWTRHGSH